MYNQIYPLKIKNPNARQLQHWFLLQKRNTGLDAVQERIFFIKFVGADRCNTHC